MVLDALDVLGMNDSRVTYGLAAVDVYLGRYLTLYLTVRWQCVAAMQNAGLVPVARLGALGCPPNHNFRAPGQPKHMPAPGSSVERQSNRCSHPGTAPASVTTYVHLFSSISKLNAF